MRKDVALHGHTGGVEDPILGAFERLAGMTDEVRIPRLQSSAIERQAQHGQLAIDEAMEGHRKMRLHAIRELDHVGGREAIRHDTVQFLPEYDGAVGHLVQRREQML